MGATPQSDQGLRPCSSTKEIDIRFDGVFEQISVERQALYKLDETDSFADTRKPSPQMAEEAAVPMPLEDIVGNLDEPFSTTLLQLIDKSGKNDADVYKCANIDRRLFSKIRSNSLYAPSKPTVLAFAVALELTLKQTEDLLNRAGFALSRSRKFDVIVEYFIANGVN